MNYLSRIINMINLDREEINFIIYRYLVESGFSHSAFIFGTESKIVESKLNKEHFSDFLLLNLLEKLLTFIELEIHFDKENECNEKISLLIPHICKEKNVNMDNDIDIPTSHESNNSCLLNEQNIKEVKEKLYSNFENKLNFSIIEEFREKVLKCYFDTYSDKVVVIKKESHPVLYNIDHFCKKLGELPHCFLDDIKGLQFSYDIINVTFSNDTLYFATLDFRGILRVWNGQNSKFLNFRECERNSIIRFSVVNNLLLFTNKNRINIWYIITDQVKYIVDFPNFDLKDVYWRNSDEFITLYQNGLAKFWLISLYNCYKVISLKEENYLFFNLLFTKEHAVFHMRNENLLINKFIMFSITNFKKTNFIEIFDCNLNLIQPFIFENISFLAIITASNQMKFLSLNTSCYALIDTFDNTIISLKISKSNKHFAFLDSKNNLIVLKMETSFKPIYKRIFNLQQNIIDIKWHNDDTIVCFKEKSIFKLEPFKLI